MATFVHLTPARGVQQVLQGGIRASQARHDLPRGVLCQPVLAHFYATHQWIGEARAYGDPRIFGVYFRIPDDEAVMVGHFGEPHARMAAASASEIITNFDDPLAYEIVVQRDIGLKDILQTQEIGALIGWWYDAKTETRRLCACAVCRPQTSRSGRRPSAW